MRELPRRIENLWKEKEEEALPRLSQEDLDAMMRASYAGEGDLCLTRYRKRQLRSFQELYIRLLPAVSIQPREVLAEVISRSKVINFSHRLIGDGLVLLPGQWMPLERRRGPLHSQQDRFVNTVLRRLDSYKETL